ncbi:MAG: hypothetical protein MI755_16250 [Sphingomonadales bacterium]|nr:hypothetical protein [Sphingomonadales bacterium]
MDDVFKHKRPAWCPYQDCIFKTVAGQHSFCIGQLSQPEPHGAGSNTHRMCLHGAKDDGEWTFDLQINGGDVFWMRQAFFRVFG